MEMRQVALLVIFRRQKKGKLPDVTGFHGQRRFNLEKNPPIADIFQLSLAALTVSRFRLAHDEPDGQLKVKSRMTSIVHGNSLRPQSGDLGLLPSQLRNPESLTVTLPTRADL
jgi:hypothetical protein